jgi:hypothetical protein
MVNMGTPPMGIGMNVPGGMPGMPPMSIYHLMGSSMPMPLMSTAPGTPPMVAVNGLMRPMSPSMNNLDTTGSNTVGRGRQQLPVSPYDLSGEFGGMQLSMKRARSSTPALSSSRDLGDGHPVAAGNRTMPAVRSSLLSVEQPVRSHSTHALR